jgi:uncharacterized protein with PIN domain
VLVRCYAELNDYLRGGCGQRDRGLPLSSAPNIAALIAELGIPLNEVEVILVNGKTSELDRRLHDGDRVSLYPVFESFDVTPVLRLRMQPLRQVRFVADAHLGRLARYLRFLGFDTLFENDPGDAELARISSQDRRILLSRDRRLLERRIVSHGLWIPSVRPREQLVYVVDRLDLRRLFRPFTRCSLCNRTLALVEKDISNLPLPPRTRDRFQTFWRCDGCGRIYWQGSHYDRLRAFIDQLGRRHAESHQG